MSAEECGNDEEALTHTVEESFASHDGERQTGRRSIWKSSRNVSEGRAYDDRARLRWACCCASDRLFNWRQEVDRDQEQGGTHRTHSLGVQQQRVEDCLHALSTWTEASSYQAQLLHAKVVDLHAQCTQPLWIETANVIPRLHHTRDAGMAGAAFGSARACKCEHTDQTLECEDTVSPRLG